MPDSPRSSTVVSDDATCATCVCTSPSGAEVPTSRGNSACSSILLRSSLVSSLSRCRSVARREAPTACDSVEASSVT